MGDMKKTSSLADLGVDADIGKSIFKKIYYHAVMDTPTKSYTKITIVDVGNVGMAIAQTILTQDIVEELALIGTNFDKFQGEMLDLQHATAFLPRVQIQADTDYAITAQSNLCIIAAGSRQNPRETRLDLLQHNLNIFRSIVPKLVEKSSGCLLLVVTNPVDVLTYITWKLSGFPPNRVIGSGTNLDSSRFRFLLADYLDVNAQDIQAYMVGEHGDSSVALWSSISVEGVSILSFVTNKSEEFEQQVLENIRKKVVHSAYEVIRLKGYTSWAVGYSVANLARSLLRDQRKIRPVSLLSKGFYGIGDDFEVFLSLPTMLGRSGVLSVAQITLTDVEKGRLQNSAKILWEIQRQLNI